MKPIKAWAIVSRAGKIQENADGYCTVFADRNTAELEMLPSRSERIVPVEIREVPTAKKGGKR